MISAIVVTHGRLAEEFIATAHKIYGGFKGVYAVSNEDKSPQTLASDVDAIIDSGGPDDSFVILVDFLGGSCGHATLSVERRRRNVRVVSGVNLPMLLAFLNKRADVASNGPRRTRLARPRLHPRRRRRPAVNPTMPIARRIDDRHPAVVLGWPGVKPDRIVVAQPRRRQRLGAPLLRVLCSSRGAHVVFIDEAAQQIASEPFSQEHCRAVRSPPRTWKRSTRASGSGKSTWAGSTIAKARSSCCRSYS
jgi:PTS system mannose-specific IIA component